MSRHVQIAAEDFLGVALLSRIARDARLLPTDSSIRTQGRPDFLSRVPGFNAAARRFPWIVTCDLDDDACAIALVRAAVPQPNPWLCFRVAVREAESWLLGDQAGIESHFGVNLRASTNWDGHTDPKRAFLEALLGAKDRQTREAMVRRKPGGKLSIGPEYNACASEFVSTAWNPSRAAMRSPSLARARRRIAEFAKRLRSAGPIPA